GAACSGHGAACAGVRSRLVALLPIVRSHVGHPEFGGSFSLKQVAPVLAPSVDYDDLDGVSEGGEASRALIGLALGAFGSAEEEASVRRALLEYCRRDTLALVELHRALGRLQPGPATAGRRGGGPGGGEGGFPAGRRMVGGGGLAGKVKRPTPPWMRRPRLSSSDSGVSSAVIPWTPIGSCGKWSRARVRTCTRSGALVG